ncbi:MAG: hypothetical protein PHF75_07140 [Gallionella sp.]|nr:hypothetical protein [Gallionella sp.]
MKTKLALFILLATGCTCSALAADPTQPGQTHLGASVGNSAQSSGHASASVGHSIAASGQVTSAASAIPLAIGGVVSGTAGAVSGQAAHNSAQAATAPIGTPLNITDETITVMPPNEALKNKDQVQPKDSDKHI